LNYSIVFMLSMVMAIPLTFVHLIKKSYRDAERARADS
jgi:hypothetical protein